MATILAISILDRASRLLQDDTHIRFPEQELLMFLNDGQREVVLHRPDSNMVNTQLTGTALASGSKQVLPSAALRLIQVIRNVNGRSVTQVDRRILDESLPNWHNTVDATGAIQHYVHEASDPKVFYVYPKAIQNTTALEVAYSASPSDIVIADTDFLGGSGTDSTTVIGLDDTYGNCLLDYILYRAYQKDSSFAGNAQRSLMHYQSFSNALGIKTQADAALMPTPDNIMPTAVMQ